MCVRFRGVWPMAPRGLLGRRRRVDCVAGGAAWTVWPMAPRGLLGLGAAPVARCVWLDFGRLTCEIRGFRPRGAKKEAWLSAGPPFSCDWSYLPGFSPLVAEIEFSLCCGHRLPI